MLQVINNPENLLHPDNHIFLTPHRNIYEAYSQYGNVVLDERTKNWFKVYDKSCDWFIVHGCFTKKDGLILSKRVKNKIVFRYWGGRRPMLSQIDGRPFHNLLINIYQRLYRMIYKYIYGHFALIGIANIVDVLDIGDILPDVPMMRMPYSDINSKETISNLLAQPKRNDGIIKIIIGHRSDKNEHHIKYIDLLQRFSKENIEIYIPLSYGDLEYAKTVKKYIALTKAKHVTVIDEFLDKGEYLKLLRDMDIALIDGETSCALGNISIHVQFENTIFISRTGLIKKAFERESIPFHCLDEIEKMEFSEFAKPLTYNSVKSEEFSSSSYNSPVEYWKTILNYLDEKEKLNS